MSKIVQSIDWSKVDWSKTNKALALELPAGHCTIASHRPKDRPSPRTVALDHAASIDWSNVNWKHSNRRIAFKLGVSPTFVRKMRMAIKAGPDIQST